MSSRQEMVAALVAARIPRPEALARDAARRLFPTWQAILVGAPAALIIGTMTGLLLTLLVALPLGHFVGQPRPAWFGRMSEVVFFVGLTLGVLLVVFWLRRRRGRFAALVREGTMVPTFDVASSGQGRLLGNKVVQTFTNLAFSGVGGTLAQVYGAPIVGGEIDGIIIEARTPGNWQGRFLRPSHMLVQTGNRYVALLGEADLNPQRVLRRRPAGQERSVGTTRGAG